MSSYRILDGYLSSQLAVLPDHTFDAVLCDPPYHLTQNGHTSGFMGHVWDGGDVAFRTETWADVMRTMKPGAYLMAFGGARTFHRMAVAMEDAGLILVDTIMWIYFSGFPKGINVAASVDKKMGGSGKRTGPPKKNTHDGSVRNPATHGIPADLSNTGLWGLNQSPHGLPTVALETEEGMQWAGYSTSLKPAYEPILLCRKPFVKPDTSYASNAIRWGCGALNIDGCRVPTDGEKLSGGTGITWSRQRDNKGAPVSNGYAPSAEGRWPANLIMDECAAQLLDTQSDRASRFIYVSKVSPKERNAGMNTKENDHPTLKPIDLTRQLATLLLPPPRSDGQHRRIMVPFSGAGSEIIGALKAGWDDVTGIEQSTEYVNIAQKRIQWWLSH